MAATFFLSQQSMLDSNGDPISGAKLHCYAEGTTTAQTVYSDEALTTAHANPIIADANGRFGNIYLQALAYKFVLKDASDVTIWTLDNFNPDGGTVSITELNDSVIRIVDDGDTSKKLAFQVSGVSASTTRTVTVFDADGTMVLDTATQTLTNKTLTSPTINAGALSGTFTGSPTLSGNPVFSGSPDFSSAGNKATIRSDLGLAIDTDVQAYDAGLASIAGLTTAANKMIYTTSSDTYAVADLSAFGRTLIDDASASAARTTLGLGTISTQAASSVAITGGAIDGATVGATTAATGAFTTLGATGLSTLAGGIYGDNFMAVGRGLTSYDTSGYEIRLSATGATPALLVDRDGTPIISTNSDDELVCANGINGRREQLTGNRTYYVSTTGSDSNDGLSSGAPFATFAKAWAIIRDELDLRGYVVTVSVADGTYTETLNLFGHVVGQQQAGDVVFQGNTTTPANCVISTTSADAISVHDNALAKIDGFKLQTTTTGHGVKVWSGARLTLDNIDYGACATAHIQVADGYATYEASGAAVITGNSPIHIIAEVADGHFDFSSATITATGTPAFSTAFINAGEGALVSIHSVTWGTGTSGITGKRYEITNEGNIVSNTVAETDLLTIPGDSAGTHTSRVRNFLEEVNFDEGVGFDKAVTVGAASTTYNLDFNVIGAGGEVVATPSSNAIAVLSNNGESGLAIHSNAANSGWLYFGTTGAGGNTKGSLEYDHATNTLNINTNGALAASIDSSGVLDLVGSLEVDGVKVVGNQESGTGETVGFTAGAGTAVLDDSTFTGNVGSTAYRISDIVKALKNHGLLAS